jgi:beta-glucosidase
VDCPAPLVSGDVTVSVQVKNEGTRTGDEVVQVYLKPTSEQQPDQEQPWNKEVNAITWSKKLVSFERIHLLPGETKTLKFVVPIESFATVDVQDAGMVYVPGTYQLEFSNGVDQSSTCNAVL